MRDVERVDLEGRSVSLAPAIRPRSLELAYDYLVVAVGRVNDFSSMPGVPEHTLAFRSLGDALRLRNHVLQALEEAETEDDPEFRRRLLTFVVAGGGFSGVEVVAELNDFLKAAARAFQRIRPEEIHCLLVHSGDRILPEIDAGLAAHAHELLLRRGVSIRLNGAIAAATADSAVLRNGEAIPTRTLVSTVPSGPVPVVQAMDVEKKAGRLMVNARLELEGHEGSVWALGDCCFVHTEDGRFVPPSAQYADPGGSDRGPQHRRRPYRAGDRGCSTMPAGRRSDRSGTGRRSPRCPGCGPRGCRPGSSGGASTWRSCRAPIARSAPR